MAFDPARLVLDEWYALRVEFASVPVATSLEFRNEQKMQMFALRGIYS